MSLLFLLIFLYFLSLRLLRWAAIWQQKEYRLDRLIAYLKTKEGSAELNRFILFPLSKNQIKRPHFTSKMVLILVLTGCFLGTFNWGNIFSLAGMYLLIPLWLTISTIPTWIITYIIRLLTEKKAQALLSKASPTIIGVSGSYGKTTTKILIGELFKQQESTWVSPKSHNNPLSIAQAIVNTYTNQKYVILEYAAYKKGEIKYLANKYPASLAVFTGINEQHLALFGNRKSMISAESELIESLSKGSRLYFNDMDPTVSEIARSFDSLMLIPASNCKLYKVKLAKSGYLEFSLTAKGSIIKTQLVGKHYLANIQQSINVARSFGISDISISKTLKDFEPGDEFIRTQKTKQGMTLIIDDRTSNPDGFKSAIDLISKMDAEHKLIVSSGIIDLGTAENKVHTELAKLMVGEVDQFLHTGETGKESLRSNLDDKYYSITNSAQLKQHLHKSLGTKTLILIEGKIPQEIYNYLVSL